jgi:hypothetical protein
MCVWHRAAHRSIIAAAARPESASRGLASINELEVLAHLMICLAADRFVETDGADANADIDTGASAPAPPPLEIDAWPPPQGSARRHS